MGGADGGHGGERLLDELLRVGAGDGVVHDHRTAVLGDGVGAGGRIERALDVTHAVDPLQAPHDVLDSGGDLRVAGSLALDEHLLARAVREAGGDEHVGALGFAAAGRGLVEIVLADLAAYHDGEDDEQDPADDGCLAVMGAPSTEPCREVMRFHAGLLHPSSYAVRRAYLYTVRTR
jgi:hypothetical protein